MHEGTPFPLHALIQVALIAVSVTPMAPTCGGPDLIVVVVVVVARCGVVVVGGGGGGFSTLK